MLNQETKRHIDAARQVLVGVVPNPGSQIDQITNALIYKFMDDMDQASLKAGGDASFFTGNLEKYAWTKLMDQKIGNQERMNLYDEALRKFSLSSQLPELFRTIFKSAFLPYRSPETLGIFLKEIDYFDYSHSEELGNAYEYLLSIMSSQGDAGQFRTPRHIIEFIIDAINPTKDDKILDPACGTGGFLVSAYKHILEQHDGKDDRQGKEKPLTPDQKRKLMQNFEGYDIDPTMARIAQVNMYLHQFKNPKIVQYDTLSQDEFWDDKFDVILANPPFMSPKGGIKPHSKFSIPSNRSEVLFVDYIANHLKPQGRAGIIVPEGIIFQSGTAYKTLRKNLIDDGLYAVVSLPSGVFQPYSGVKTSILLIDKEFAKKSNEILFIKIENDGFDLGAQRRLNVKNDLPQALQILQKWQVGEKIESKLVSYIDKTKIAENGDYNLSGDRYRVATDYSKAKWEMVELGEVCEVIAGQSPEGHFYNESGEGMPFYQGKTEFTDKYIGSPKKWTTKVTKIAEENDILMSVRAPVGPVNIATQKICIGRGIASIRPKKANGEYVFGLLRAMQNLIKGNSGATFDSINKTDIEKLKIPLPPLEIQEQIVSELDGYSSIIAGAKQIVTNWKPKIDTDSSWEMVTFDKILDRVSSSIDPKNKKGEVFYVGLENIESNSGSIAGNLMTNYQEIKSLKNSFKSGDILYGKLRPNLNKVWLANCEGICSTDILVFRAKENSDTNFYWCLMLSEEFVNEVMTGIKGAQLPRVGFEYLRNIILPLPPIETQQQIVSQIEAERTLVESAKKLIEIYEQKTKAVIKKLWEE